MSDYVYYPAIALTGGSDDALDGYDGDDLNDKDVAIVVTAASHYYYILDADSGASESSPDVIKPDSNAGTKRWILIKVFYTKTEADAITDPIKNAVDYAASPMIVTGGEITVGTNAGTFKVAALTALLRETHSKTGHLTYVTLAEQDNQTIASADTMYMICLDYNGGTPQIVTSTSNPYNSGTDYTQIPIGRAMKDGSDNVHYISGGYTFQDGVEKLHVRARTLRVYEMATGCSIAYSGTNNFTMTSGVGFGGLNKFSVAPYDSAVTTFIPVYSDGGAGWTYGVASNVIDFAHYDDGDGVLGEVGNAKYGCHWVYRHLDDGDVYVVYGTVSTTLASAEVASEPSKPDMITNFGTLIGRIIAPQAGGSFASIQMVTDTIFSGTDVSDHNELSSLQGGSATERYHLTSAQNVNLTDAGILTVDGTYQGEVITVTVDDASASFGTPLYCAADFHYERTDADDAGTMPCVAVALESGAGSKKVLLRGQLCKTVWTLSAGPIYVSCTTGYFAQSAPAGGGDQVQKVGFALSADTIFFDPDSTVTTV